MNDPEFYVYFDLTGIFDAIFGRGPQKTDKLYQIGYAYGLRWEQEARQTPGYGFAELVTTLERVVKGAQDYLDDLPPIPVAKGGGYVS